jgi:hypothetical protein
MYSGLYKGPYGIVMTDFGYSYAHVVFAKSVAVNVATGGAYDGYDVYGNHICPVMFGVNS